MRTIGVMDRKGSYKDEFINLSDEDLEIRYFNGYNGSSYRSWRIPKVVIEELIVWLKK